MIGGEIKQGPTREGIATAGEIQALFLEQAKEQFPSQDGETPEAWEARAASALLEQRRVEWIKFCSSPEGLELLFSVVRAARECASLLAMALPAVTGSRMVN